jgi:RimJ/RimL family protein N-acetyltransferase
VKLTIGSLELRRFAMADARALYAVRDHESVRRFMADPSPLAYASHLDWVFRNLIEGDAIVLFLARVHREPVGLTLLKRRSEHEAEIGVMFREASRHAAVIPRAAVATLYLAFEEFGLRSLVSYVIPGHERAVAFNTGLGGREAPSDKPGMRMFHATREECLGHPRYVRMMERMRPRMRLSRE